MEEWLSAACDAENVEDITQAIASAKALKVDVHTASKLLKRLVRANELGEKLAQARKTVRTAL